MPPVLELEAATLTTDGVEVELCAYVAGGVVVGACVIVDWNEDEKDGDELELEEENAEEELLDLIDTLKDELEEEEYEVEEAVVGRTRFPAVTVRICAPIADAPLNVVVEEVAVEVIVPRMALTDLLHVP